MVITKGFQILAIALLANFVNQPVSLAQTPRAGAAFEVASVKLSSAERGESGLHYGPGRFTATNVVLKLLIKEAYQVKGFQITGAPEWTASQRYDVNARASANASVMEIRVMLQNLLMDRFKLSIRRDTKELPVYALVVAKTGARLGEKITDGAAQHQFSPGNSSFKGQASVSELAEYLSGQVQRVVLDRTGMEGVFNIAFKFVPEGRSGARIGDDSLRSDSSDGVSIFSAIQGLGLKLESQKAQVPVLHIDRLEKEPAEN